MADRGRRILEWDQLTETYAELAIRLGTTSVSEPSPRISLRAPRFIVEVTSSWGYSSSGRVIGPPSSI